MPLLLTTKFRHQNLPHSALSPCFHCPQKFLRTERLIHRPKLSPCDHSKMASRTLARLSQRANNLQASLTRYRRPTPANAVPEAAIPTQRRALPTRSIEVRHGTQQKMMRSQAHYVPLDCKPYCLYPGWNWWASVDQYIPRLHRSHWLLDPLLSFLDLTTLSCKLQWFDQCKLLIFSEELDQSQSITMPQLSNVPFAM